MPLSTSKNSKTFPKISIIIPTLNSGKILESCLKSIKIQQYKNIEIIIADGGSVDDTLKIAKKYNCKIFKNSLQTSESGKAIGLKHTIGKYVAFIDSDNILPNTKWLSQMIYPLENDPKIIGSEPWEFTYRPDAGFIERYSSLIGANDPYAYITGIYDRRNFITKSWTALNLVQKNYKKYIKIKLEPNKPIPTIGANGTVFRFDFLKDNFNGDYLFDIDIITQALNKIDKPLYFAKTKNGIIHTYCESSISKFYKKQMRRLKDYYQFKHLRYFNYQNTISLTNAKFILYTILVFPMIYTTILGYIRKPDIAWFFHPIACIITLYCYVYVSILYLLGFKISQSRNTWSQ